MDKVTDAEALYKQEFHLYRGGYVNEVLTKVTDEINSSYIGDYVNVMLNHENYEVCTACCHVYPFSDLDSSDVICPKCNYNASFYEHNFDPYYRTPSKRLEGASMMHIGEPFIQNPNSLEAVKNVVLYIRQICSGGGKRKWTIIHCDRVPYCYDSKLQDEQLICQICSRS